MLFWTPHFSALNTTFFVLDSTFWLDSTLKIDPGYIQKGSAEEDAIKITTSPQIFIYYEIVHKVHNKNKRKK